MKTEADVVKALFEDLEHFEQLVVATFSEMGMTTDHEAWNEVMDRHMVFGRQYHSTAVRIKALTGIDPRPAPC